MTATAGPDDLYRSIADALVAGAPGNWVTVRAMYLVAGKLSEFEGGARTADGQDVWLDLPETVATSFEALRRLFYQQGKGAWYTATFLLQRDGTMSLDLDYDPESAWDIPAMPETYVEDLEMFPRDEAAQPQWLRDKVRGAGHRS